MLLGRRLDQLDIRRNGWDNLFATEDKRELAEQLLNHLDKKGCDALMEILSHRRGGIIYVSHQDLVREGNMSTVFFFVDILLCGTIILTVMFYGQFVHCNVNKMGGLL